MMRNRKGFTIVEVVIVLAIIGILAMVAVPNITGWIYHLRFTGFLRDVYSQFQEGRTRALATGIAHNVLVDTSANTVSLRRASDNVAVRPVLTAPSNCDIVSGSSVTFNHNGTANGSGGVRIVNNHSAADNNVINVTLGTGRIVIQ